jgi:tetratricopeptide (TPR) repeat protein
MADEQKTAVTTTATGQATTTATTDAAPSGTATSTEIQTAPGHKEPSMGQELRERLKELTPNRGTLTFLGVVAALVGVVLLFWYFYASSEAMVSARWHKLDDVIFPAQLEAVLSDSELRGTAQERLAKFMLARQKLASGLRDLGNSPDTAVTQIDEATKIYEELAKSGRPPLLQQEALSGAARGYEALGLFDKAKEKYGRLVKDFPSSALGVDAKKQLDRLSGAGEKQAEEIFQLLKPKS